MQGRLAEAPLHGAFAGLFAGLRQHLDAHRGGRDGERLAQVGDDLKGQLRVAGLCGHVGGFLERGVVKRWTFFGVLGLVAQGQGQGLAVGHRLGGLGVVVGEDLAQHLQRAFHVRRLGYLLTAPRGCCDRKNDGDEKGGRRRDSKARQSSHGKLRER